MRSIRGSSPAERVAAGRSPAGASGWWYTIEGTGCGLEAAARKASDGSPATTEISADNLLPRAPTTPDGAVERRPEYRGAFGERHALSRQR